MLQKLMYQKSQKNVMRRTIYINCSKNFSPTASIWGNVLRHSTRNFAAQDTKFGSLGITSGLSLFLANWPRFFVGNVAWRSRLDKFIIVQ